MTALSQPHRAVYKSTSELAQHLSIQDNQLGPNGVHYREVPLHIDTLVRVCIEA